MKLLVTFIFLSVVISVSTVNARTIDTINSTGTLKVCALSERMPFSSKSGERSGIQIELATELAKELNVELEVIWLRYRFHARKAGCDLMMEAVARKDDDENKRDIEGARPLTRASDSKKSKLPPQASIPIIKYETYLVGRQETINGNNTLSAIKELNMGVMRGTWSHKRLCIAHPGRQSSYLSLSYVSRARSWTRGIPTERRLRTQLQSCCRGPSVQSP